MAYRDLRRCAVLLVGLTLATLPAWGQERNAAVGAQGELYQVREGAYGDLFPDQGLGDPSSSALALDVTYPDQSHARFLVPGTESEDLDSNASVLFESQSDTLFLLWKSEKGNIHTWLNVVGFHDGTWGQPIEVSGNLFGWKSDPQFTVTRDTFRSQGDDGTVQTWTRTVIHLLWWEEENVGEPVPYYAPITLINGEYTGKSQVYRLDELLSSALGSLEPVPPNYELAKAQKVEAGSSAHSATLGFVDPSSGRLVCVTLDLIPGEIDSLADRIRHQIIEVGRKVTVGQPTDLAAQMRDAVLDLGTTLGFHPSVTDYLAAQVFAGISSSSPSEELSSLADRIRHQIIEVGARLTGTGLGRISSKSSPLTADLPSDGTGATGPAGQLTILVTSVLPSPATGSDQVDLHLSSNGREAIVSWVENGVVYYRESQGTTWSSPRQLRLDANLDLSRAHQLLDQRAEERGVE